MKALAALTLSTLLISTNALAFTTKTLNKVLKVPTVKATLDRQSIRAIKDGPSPRCAGCSALDVTTFTQESGETHYRLQIQDFAGTFSVRIYRIPGNGFDPNEEN